MDGGKDGRTRKPFSFRIAASGKENELLFCGVHFGLILQYGVSVRGRDSLGQRRERGADDVLANEGTAKRCKTQTSVVQMQFVFFSRPFTNENDGMAIAG